MTANTADKVMFIIQRKGCKLSSQSFSSYTLAKEFFDTLAWHKNPTTVRYCILIDLTHGIVIDHFENEPVKV